MNKQNKTKQNKEEPKETMKKQSNQSGSLTVAELPTEVKPASQEGMIQSSLVVSDNVFLLCTGTNSEKQNLSVTDNEDYCPFKKRMLDKDQTLNEYVKQYLERPEEKIVVETPVIPTPKWTLLNPVATANKKASQGLAEKTKKEEEREDQASDVGSELENASTYQTDEEKSPFSFVVNQIDPQVKGDYKTLNAMFDAGVKKYTSCPQRKREKRLWQLPEEQ